VLQAAFLEKIIMSEKTKTAWIINGLLAVILVLLLGYLINLNATPAYAAGGGWETDGVMATTALDTEHVILIDTKSKTIMIYKNTANAFRLVGARSYEYDVEVEDTAGTAIEKGQGATWKVMRDQYEKKAPK
jgi:hypothetical protein